MATKIRLARGGSKKRPYYRIVVADARSPRDGKFITIVGRYNPLLAKDDENRVIIDQDLVKHWLNTGAQPTDKVRKFLEKINILSSDPKKQFKNPRPPKKVSKAA